MTRAAANDRVGDVVHVGALVDEAMGAALARATQAWQPRMAETRERLERKAAAEHERREREQAAAAEQAARARIARLRRAGVPDQHLRVLCGLPDDDGRVVVFDPEKHSARTVREWRATKHRTLVLGGAMGAGKSVAACWLIDQGPRRPYPHPDGFDAAEWPDELRPRYVHAARLARMSMFGRAGGASELEIIERCSILVIDEIGGVEVGKAADWVARFDGLVAVRADNRLDTVITTNLRVEDTCEEHGKVGRACTSACKVTRGFRTMYGERVLDRMRADGRCWVEFAGASLRESGRWEAPRA